MRVIAVANNKGGVGKTSVTAHIAFWFAERGRRVLVVDLDDQGNVSGCFVERDETLGKSNSLQLFTKDSRPKPMATEVDRIDLLPACPELGSADKGTLSDLFGARDHLRALAETYDVVVIDTPPSLGLRVHTALAASTHVVCPLQPEKFGLEGLARLLEELGTVRANLAPELGDPLFVLNLLTPNSRNHQVAIQMLEDQFALAKPYLRRHIAVTDALADRRPVWVRPTNLDAAKDWRELCGAIEEFSA